MGTLVWLVASEMKLIDEMKFILKQPYCELLSTLACRGWG